MASSNPPEKYEFARVDHHPNYWGRHKIHVPVTTHQLRSALAAASALEAQLQAMQKCDIAMDIYL